MRRPLDKLIGIALIVKYVRRRARRSRDGVPVLHVEELPGRPLVFVVAGVMLNHGRDVPVYAAVAGNFPVVPFKALHQCSADEVLLSLVVRIIVD